MAKPTDVVRIGVGAGFADDRIEPAIDLVERADLDFLVFECLAERTTARESLTKRHDPEERLQPAPDRAHGTHPATLPRQARSHRHQYGRGQSRRRCDAPCARWPKNRGWAMCRSR